MSLEDQILGKRPTTGRVDRPLPLYSGRVTRAPADHEHGVRFRLDEFSPDREWGPAPWPSRTDDDGLLLPDEGDHVWAFMTGEGPDPVVVLWWPADYEDPRT